MRQILAFLIFSTLISCNVQGVNKARYDISYQKKSDIYVLRFVDKKEVKFKDGFDPAISPDGKRLAYTKSKDLGRGFIRYIVIADLDTNNETKLNVRNDNYYGASWSPDNLHIAFNIFSDKNWSIGFINSDNTGFKIIKANSDRGLFQPTWTPDGKYIIAHNMQKIFKFDLSGAVVDTIDFVKMTGGNYYGSSSSKYLFTSDNRYIIFNCGIDEAMKNVEGRVEAVFSYDTKYKSITRLSPKGMFAFDINLESDKSILFCGTKENEEQSSVYSVDLNSKMIEPIIKNASRPTMSKKKNVSQSEESMQ